MVYLTDHSKWTCLTNQNGPGGKLLMHANLTLCSCLKFLRHLKHVQALSSIIWATSMSASPVGAPNPTCAASHLGEKDGLHRSASLCVFSNIYLMYFCVLGICSIFCI